MIFKFRGQTYLFDLQAPFFSALLVVPGWFAAAGIVWVTLLVGMFASIPLELVGLRKPLLDFAETHIWTAHKVVYSLLVLSPCFSSVEKRTLL